MTDAIRLERALDRVHNAVLKADFTELPKFVTEMELLLGKLAGLPDQIAAARLRRKAVRNSHCLQAAARGLRAAQRRLIEMSASTSSLSTYTSQGKRSDLGIGPGSLAQRI